MVLGGVAYNESRLLSCTIPAHQSAAVSDTPPPSESAREVLMWAGLSVALALGLVLYFRFADRITSLLDVVTDK